MWQTKWVRGEDYDDNCHGESDCLGACINSSKVEYHFAQSPAFAREEYQSVRYSTWAESTLVRSCDLCIFLLMFTTDGVLYY